LEHVARVHDAGWIDCDVSFVNVPDDAFFVDQEGGAISEALLLIIDAVVFYHGAFEIAEDRKCYFNLFCKFAVGGDAVNTEAEYLSVIRFEFGDISLIRLQFLRSTAGECQHINRQHDVFLTFEIAQLVRLSVSGAKREVGRRVTNLQMCFDWRLLAQCDYAKDGKQYEGCQQSFVHSLLP
jgi:hypothetical protein